MNRPFLTSALATLTLAALSAQSLPNLKPANEPDPEIVAEAIRKFKASRGMPTHPKEITVDLTDSAPAPAKPAPEPPADAPPAAETTPAPDPAGDFSTSPDAGPPPESPAESPAEGPAESLTVKVEQLETGNGPIDPAKVKLLAPFPAKPLGAIPAGWKLDSSAAAPSFTHSVEIAAETSITLTIKPHVLVPAADGSSAFSVNEPGFDPAHGYQQAQTVGAVLSRSLQQLDEDAKQLGNAIEQLQQLVSTLPKPALEPEPIPESKPKPSNQR